MSQNGIQIYNQGYSYYTGKNGFPLNYSKALECFKQAAELGVSQAMNFLGLMYENGDVVEKNYKTAADWFYKAVQADPKNPHAAMNLGRMYYLGAGVEKDMAKAYQYCKASADLGVGNKHSAYPRTCYLTGCILMEHYNNMKAAYPYFIQAAKYGNMPEAFHNLGWITEKGCAPPKNNGGDDQATKDGIAKEFYERAANLGCVQSMDALGRLYCKYQQMNEAESWLRKAASKGYEPAKKRLKMLGVAQSGSLFDFLGAFFEK